MYIYGAGNCGRHVFEILSRHYPFQLKFVKGFIDRNKEGQIDKLPIISLKNVDKRERIVIAINSKDTAIEVQNELNTLGFTDIWWFVGKWKIYGDDFFDEICVSCRKWNGVILKQVEMHVMDACNLNCRGCAHFSPIFKMEVPDFESRISDVELFAKKFGHIIRFVLLGGEPFLNPEIGKYVEEVRRVLPESQVEIVTNGLLIPTIDEEILKSIKRNHVRVSISEYEPTHNIIKKVIDKLEKFKISYEIRRFERKKIFNIPLSLVKDSVYEKKCISNGCITIWNGKMARCPTLMYIDEFNKRFNKSLPNDGIMMISEKISGEELISKFNERVPLCDYCVLNECEWDVCGNNVKCSDFAVDN